MNETRLPIFIGYDAREDEAFNVCRYSLFNRSSQHLNVIPLKHRELRRQALFDRPWKVDGPTGQFLDERDGKPFSTEFSHTRFLIPHIAGQRDLTGWALFCDCDFLFLDDVAELFALADDKYAVMCVKHLHTPPEGVKMDYVAQTRYRRKNWSSLVLWNLKHPANLALKLEDVNYKPGSWLHAFEWLADDLIGGLPEEWNWLSGHSSDLIEPKAVHFTEGGPWFPEYRHVPYAKLWLAERGNLANPRLSIVREYSESIGTPIYRGELNARAGRA